MDDEMIINVWCDDCHTFVDDFSEYNNWICCSACGNGIMQIKPGERVSDQLSEQDIVLKE